MPPLCAVVKCQLGKQAVGATITASLPMYNSNKHNNAPYATRTIYNLSIIWDQTLRL